jgi:hypothetical protein
MVVYLYTDLVFNRLPAWLYLPAAIGIVSVFILNALASGRKTSRDRDLHGRTILLTVSWIC